MFEHHDFGGGVKFRDLVVEKCLSQGNPTRGRSGLDIREYK